MSARPLLYLIDGSSQMYRAYHAPIRTAEGTLLRNSQGIPTNAVYIFVTMLRKLIKDHQPRFIAASFDLPGPTFRDDLAADYKANRAPMPPDLASQIPLVHRACEALGVPIITQPRYEADDVIGTIATRALAQGFDVAIVTGDKDFFQLVGDGVRVYNPREEGTWYDAAGVVEKFGIAPEKVVDVLALMGDAIDNVKGVPGIGEKGALSLIATYGSLDALLDRAAEVPQKKYREALLAHAQEARDSRELLRIHTNVDVPFSIEDFTYRGPSVEDCYALFSDLGFRSLVVEYAPTAATVKSDYQLVTTSEALGGLVDALRASARFGLRVLFDGSSPMRGRLIGLAFSTASRMARYVPVGHAGMHGGPQLSVGEVLAVLKPVLEDPAIVKIGHDVKADVVVLARDGVRLQGVGVDTMLAAYLLGATPAGHAIEAAALEHLGYKATTADDVLGRGARAVDLADTPPEAVLTFAAERADLALQLADTLWPMLVSQGLDSVYTDLERPLIPVLAALEQAGVRIDSALLAEQSTRLDRELAAKNAQIFELAGEMFNINSPQQLGRILFEKLQLPALKRNPKTRTPSTAVDVLEELAATHDLPRLILEWRALQKLKGTYVDALPQLVNPQTGRLHTSFNQAVAATGRLSSSDPNLQNIPIRTEIGRDIRRAFVAEPDYVLISADYSQIEFRVLAHLADDPVLVEAFRQGVDFHAQTALRIFGEHSERDAHDLRATAKMVNYAVLYGKTPFTLARDIGVTQQAAQEFIDAYFAGFPGVRAFIDRTLADARASGEVKTLYGRRRLMPELTSTNVQDRSAAERQAVNLPIQGTAADIMKRAMIDVDRALAAFPRARTILTVHDELVFEVPRHEADVVAALVRDVMESAVSLRVPLVVDVGIGANWMDAKP